ncbi:MAG: D-sedoheptulose 7-phosphate isomerase [Vicinamibacteria bacterium]
MSKARVDAVIAESLDVKRRFFEVHAAELVALADRIAERVRKGGKVLVFGNGGSAADAQHFAGELVGRFTKEGPPIPALALTTDSSIMTAIGNDYGYEYVFKRQVEAHARPEDIAVGISTSGNSKNVLEAMHVAKSRGLLTVGMTGEGGGQLGLVVDHLFAAPSKDTPRIQEVHHLMNHILCELLEERLR